MRRTRTVATNVKWWRNCNDDIAVNKADVGQNSECHHVAAVKTFYTSVSVLPENTLKCDSVLTCGVSR